MAYALPTISANDKRYFVDNRLEQFRNVANPHDVISFNQLTLVDEGYSALVFNSDTKELAEPAKASNLKWFYIPNNVFAASIPYC